MPGAVRIVHTSDLHLLRTPDSRRDDAGLIEAIARLARELRADAVVLAGDTFDHNRVPPELAEDLLVRLGSAARLAIVLPGNHDPLDAESIFVRVRLPSNVFVLGLSGSAAHDPQSGLDVTGRPHLGYADFDPLDRPSGTRRGPRVVVAHGHYADRTSIARYGSFRPAWLIRDDDLDGLDADYVALGHWDTSRAVRAAGPPVHYSGSPWLTGTVNVVDLAAEAVEVRPMGIAHVPR